MNTLTTYSLRLPKSIKAEAEKLSKADGTSLNQFVAIAVAEKISALKTAAFFAERIARASGDGSALRALLTRTGGEPPRVGDELPEGFEPRDTSQPQRARPSPHKTAGRSASKPGATPPVTVVGKPAAKLASAAGRKAQ